MLGGIAIFLMIWHHLFNFHDWLADGVAFNTHFGIVGSAIVRIPAGSGHICVQIFAIISGYALFINPTSYGSWRARITRLFKFLSVYWMIFALFLLVAFLNDDNLPSTEQFVHNLFGLHTGPSRPGVNVPFAWYVAFYIMFIVLTPVLCYLFIPNSSNSRAALRPAPTSPNSNNSPNSRAALRPTPTSPNSNNSPNSFNSVKSGTLKDITGFLSLIVAVYLLRKLPEMGMLTDLIFYLNPVISVVVGILSAKYNLFERMHQRILLKLPSIILFVFVCIDLYLIYKVPGLSPLGGNNWALFVTLWKVVMAFILVSLLLELINRIKSKVMEKGLLLAGTLSMYLWFLHGIFFTGKNFMQPELYSSREPIIIFLITLICLSPLAYLLHVTHRYLWQKIDRKNPEIKKSNYLATANK